MSNIFANILSRIYPPTEASHITILGLDYSGKTTLLYLLKLGEIVQTIPSMGLNVESIEVPLPSRGNKSGGTFKMTGWDIGTGCASPRQYIGMLRNYTHFTRAIVWVVDSSDRERLTESTEMLTEVLFSITNLGEDIMKIPILILANKCDKSNGLSIDEIRTAFTKVTTGRLISVFKSQATLQTAQNPQTSGLPQAFDWLNTALEIVQASEKTGRSITAVPQAPAGAPENDAQRAQTVLAHKLESWLNRSEDSDLSDDEYLERFKAYTLPEWDHYTHIRIAYIILTKHGRQEGKNMIFNGIQSYIANSQQTKGRTFHITMTYFWIQIVHLGIRNTPPPQPNQSNLSPLKEFTRFLLINPNVVDGNLWSDYYTKEVLMSPKAKEEMVLPDKKPLPNLVTRDAITSFGK
ncbi:ADP-ribosylation factor family-domain-containing protein [Crepidotus variabilis]|uniref:ADP-ribosylation factor family-domain-containing protein n=1 Tax=Crepidotus variabilis TaxID=179855 RepID=A0A9P6JNJ2_9AGAR|nr:ADP-ribosylation factor family-domain-containing protein [Crepidotus variabilis]